jgi:Cupin superfamily protein
MNLVLMETQSGSDNDNGMAATGLMLSVSQLSAAAYRDSAAPRIKVDAAPPAKPAPIPSLRSSEGDVSRKIFENVIAPIGIHDFFSYFWGSSFCHVEGFEDKFADLLPWTELNSILRHHRFPFPRLRLCKQGNPVPASAYSVEREAGAETLQRRRRALETPPVHVRNLYEQLQQGATMTLDAVDELYNPISELCESFEKLFNERVQANAWISCAEVPAVSPHWDDHDVFVLQVSGEKRWRIYGVTRPFPLYRDVDANTECPKDIVWEGILQPGDLLYLPRGTWHSATALGEPTLHLSLGVYSETGIDLMGWLQDHLRNSSAFRMNLPRFSSDAARRQHMKDLRREMLALWDDDILGKFLENHQTRAESRRPTLSFPWVLGETGMPDDPTTQLVWTAPRRVKLEMADQDGENVAVIVTEARRYCFSAQAYPVLQHFIGREKTSLGELFASQNGELDPALICSFVRELVLEGLVAIKI